MDEEVYDMIVIGGGLYGIQAARTYLELFPHAKLTLFEASGSIGGVWSSERMYDAFITQTPLQIAEFSDRPMSGVPKEDTFYGFYKAKYLTRYLEDYVTDCGATRKISLSESVVLNARVKELVKTRDTWSVLIDGHTQRYTSPKVIDATGLTSIPYKPSLKGLDAFQGITIHHKGFGRSRVLEDAECRDVVVFGGAKSAADIAFAAAKAGKKVSWVIRRSGNGPSAFVPAKGQAIYRNSNESFYTRFVGAFLASRFEKRSWLSSCLHCSKIGRRIFWRIWNRINQRALHEADYEREDGRGHGFHNLNPDTSLFWQNDGTSVNQREDFFDVIASSVSVYREDVGSIGHRSVILKSGTTLPADALIFGTGWKSLHPHLGEKFASELGLSVPASAVDEKTKSRWEMLDRQADESVLASYPLLGSPPPHRPANAEDVPFRLYRAILPIKDHSIAFVGKTMLGNHFRNAEVQALWSVAALHDLVEVPSEQDLELDVADTVAWCRRRYLSKGQLGNYFYYDLIPYTDTLLNDLHLKSHRKSILRDLFDPCWASDLRGLIGEFKKVCMGSAA
ncbi:MAG: monooxygenase [Chrysothrix sp. TS-e1954]|nr:MAG: monooxygenase [Chrysothrix sp. TS-e1954]